MSHRWGTVTQLSKQYLISRTFVYMLIHGLEDAIPRIFAEQTVCEKIIDKRDCYEYILSLRLEGKCGIEAISTIRNRFGYPNNSVGFISQALNNIGSLLDNTLTTNEETIQLVIYASAEIFSKTYNCYDKLDSAVTDNVIDKRIDAYEDAEKTAAQAIKLFDEFHEYYVFLINQLRVFDNDGNLRDRTEAESNIKLALDLIITLENNKINKTIKKITKLLPDLLAYFNSATTIVNELKHIAISEDILKDFCLAWQYQKNMIKAKNKQPMNFYKNKQKDKLNHLQQTIGEQYAAMVDIVYAKLDAIVQSSALVETNNSIVRSYLNTTRNHISQNL